MSEAVVLHFNQVPRVDRGGGIYSNPLVVEATGAKVFSSGITTFPPSATIALHTHNTDEQVTLLEGAAVAEIEGRQEQVNPYDTTFIPAGVPHRFIPNPPKDTDGRREDSGRGWVRELQGRWPGVLG